MSNSPAPASRSTAIVLGASISGLLVARVLSRHFQQVTIVERDELPTQAAVRQGVPQSAHTHGLLASGYHLIDGFFPGVMQELEAIGAPRVDMTGDFLWFQYGCWKLRSPSGLYAMSVSRPCLEAAIRRRVKALPNIRFVEGTEGVNPVFDRDCDRVTGLLVRHRDRKTPKLPEDVPEEAPKVLLAADLVVDASGRGSRSPKWLQEWGFDAPETASVKIDVGYATRIFERRPGEVCDSMGVIMAGTPPSQTRYAAVMAAEGDRWVVTLAGTLGDHPPIDEAGWTAFAASLPVSIVHDLITSARPLSGITQYKFPANQRRFYERMTRFPKGYLVVGDAVCSFNPIYGQGMTVAAAEAQVLDEILATNPTQQPTNFAQRFYDRARSLIDIPWLMATGEDLRFPQVEGQRPRGSWLMNRYLDRVHAAAAIDAIVCRQFFKVLNLLDTPNSLLAPDIVWRVLLHGSRTAPQTEHHTCSNPKTSKLELANLKTSNPKTSLPEHP